MLLFTSSNFGARVAFVVATVRLSFEFTFIVEMKISGMMLMMMITAMVTTQMTIRLIFRFRKAALQDERTSSLDRSRFGGGYALVWRPLMELHGRLGVYR